MSQSKLISVLRKVVAEEVRNVIKQELSDILQEGLQSTINEIKSEPEYNRIPKQRDASPKTSSKVNFKENKFSNILNNTEKLNDTSPLTANSYADLMTEDITMTSQDAMNFGASRKMSRQNNISPSNVLTDPDTGAPLEATPIVDKVINRDYSALMKAIDKKKNR